MHNTEFKVVNQYVTTQTHTLKATLRQPSRTPTHTCSYERRTHIGSNWCAVLEGLNLGTHP